MLVGLYVSIENMMANRNVKALRAASDFPELRGGGSLPGVGQDNPLSWNTCLNQGFVKWMVSLVGLNNNVIICDASHDHHRSFLWIARRHGNHGVKVLLWPFHVVGCCVGRFQRIVRDFALHDGCQVVYSIHCRTVSVSRSTTIIII